MKTVIHPFIVLLLYSCASVKSLDGGTKDISPPIIIHSSPENYSTHVSINSIVLVFDEYIQLNNQTSEWVISPPMKKQPIATINGKRLIIKILDELSTNTTYSFSFGNSISDLNEGNVLKTNLFVFSTGALIDTFTLSGTCLDAFSQTPIKAVSVFLFDSDSSIFMSFPRFMTKCTEQGSFQLKYLPKGNYSIYSWEDVNNNNFPDKSERFAFYHHPINTSHDSLINLNLFKPFDETQFISSATSTIPGIITFSLNRPDIFDSVSIFLENSSLFKKDDIRFFRSFMSDSITCLINYPSNTDSIIFQIKQTDSTYILPVSVPASPDTLSLLEHSVSVLSNSNIQLNFNAPISKAQTFLFKLIKDSLLYNTIIKYETLLNTITLQIPFPDPGTYNLIFPYNSIKSIFSSSIFLPDTMKITVTTPPPLSDLSFQIIDSFNIPFTLQLLKEETIIASHYCKSCDYIEFKNLLPSIYTVRIIYDLNNNQRWETGNYSTHSLPEPVYRVPSEFKLKQGWNQLNVPLIIPSPLR
jgi:hypothetical protein